MRVKPTPLPSNPLCYSLSLSLSLSTQAALHPDPAVRQDVRSLREQPLPLSQPTSAVLFIGTHAPSLAHLIAYTFYHTRLMFSVTFATLYLLQRLKVRFVAARGSSGHRLFIFAFMITSKVICDDCIVGQGMFALREINQMGRKTCSYVERQLNVEPGALKEFKSIVQRVFKGPSPYPAHNRHTIFRPWCNAFSITLRNTPISPEKLLRRSSADPYPIPTDIPQLPTPPASDSNVSSPVNSMSPVTPPNYEGDGAKIVSSGGSNTTQIFDDNVSPPYHHIHACNPSSPIPAHTKTHSSIDTKHISPKRSSSSHQHIAPVKSNTMYASTHLCRGPFPKYTGSSKDWIATAQLQPSGALQATYWQKLGEKVEAAADLHLVNAPQRRDAVATLGLKYDLRMSTFRAQLDSTGSLCRGPFPLSLSVAIVA